MMFFYVNLSPGNGGRWWLAPLVTLALSIGTTVLQEWLASRSYSARGQPQHRARLQQTLLEQQRARRQQQLEQQLAAGPQAPVIDVIDVVLFLVLLGLIAKMVKVVRERGGIRAALNGARLQQQRRQAAQQRQQQQQRAPRPDFDRVVAALQRLPTDVVATRADLEKEPAHELKQRLARLGVECRDCLEKGELVEKLLSEAGGGSSGESCVICAEEYAAGDVVRVLPCRHRMHIECIDRWLLKSTEHSAAKGCPLCNDERWLTAGERPAAAAAAAHAGAAP